MIEYQAEGQQDGQTARKQRSVNGWSYLLEMVLVVVGVLMALAVDNWNEERKEAKVRAHYLIRLKTDLHLDSLELAETLASNKRGIRLADTLLNMLNRSPVPPDDTLLPRFLSLGSLTWFQPRGASYDKPVALDQIHDEALITELLQFNQVLERVRLVEKLHMDQVSKSFTPMMAENMAYKPGQGFPIRMTTPAFFQKPSLSMFLLGYKSLAQQKDDTYKEVVQHLDSLQHLVVRP